MGLGRVRISNLRCLVEVDVTLHPRRSYLFGANGAGKTSFLEALYLLGRGRSFRARQLRALIRHGMPGFTVHAELTAASRLRRLGVGYVEGRLLKHIDGAEAAGMAALAEVLQVHALDPSMHALVEGGPGERRRFLDWGVFHVERSYLDTWKRYRRALSQRNAALKRGAGNVELASWTDALVRDGVEVDRHRRHYVERLDARVSEFGLALLGQPLRLRYRSGWPQGASLESALAATAADERGMGATSVGPHRADLSLLMADRRVQDDASRGQQKLTAAALILGQVAVAQQGQSAEGLLLVDDPSAELDGASLRRLLGLIEALPGQQVLTGLDRAAMPIVGDSTVFHVERGAVRAL